MSDTVDYRVIVHEEPDEDCFWAEVVEVPGCFASGRDLSELEEALAEALGLALSVGSSRIRFEGLHLENDGAQSVSNVRVPV